MKNIYKIDLEGDELHEKLGGGLPKNSTVLIEGANGMGKSIFAQRLAYGAIANEHTISYISTELNVAGFMNQMNSLGYNIKQQFIKKQVKFISLYPSLGSFKFEDNLIEKIIEEPEIFDSDVIVVDRLGELLLKKNMQLSDCYKLMDFFQKLTSTGKTVIICSDPNDTEEVFTRVIRGVSDLYVSMEEKVQYGNKMNLIKIVRYTAAPGEIEQEMAFKVRAGIGIVIELAS